MSETTTDLIARMMQHVEDTMVEATVDYPAGYDAGPSVSYDSDFLQKCFETELTAALAREAGLREALRIAEAALSDIGDAEREEGDDLAWCERRASEAIPIVRAALAVKP